MCTTVLLVVVGSQIKLLLQNYIVQKYDSVIYYYKNYYEIYTYRKRGREENKNECVCILPCCVCLVCIALYVLCVYSWSSIFTVQYISNSFSSFLFFVSLFLVFLQISHRQKQAIYNTAYSKNRKHNHTFIVHFSSFIQLCTLCSFGLLLILSSLVEFIS